MEITCPEHGGVIYVPGNAADTTEGPVKSLVITCPVCDEEVLINDVQNIEEES
ncbi:MAG TPA: hypothetical protein VGD22_20000 [Sphingobacteriaceae bacterium]